MDSTLIAPLGPLPHEQQLAALPKADPHIHQEWSPRLDRVLSRRAGRAPYNWHAWAAQLMAGTPPGMNRSARAALSPLRVMDAPRKPPRVVRHRPKQPSG